MHIGAIVGYGGMGSHHEKNCLEVDEIKIKGVYDINPEKAKLAKSKGYYAYNSFEELLSDKEVDIVIIATPNDFHKPQSIACLEAGKNVICEKPVMLNAKELEEVIEVSKKTGKIFSVHQNRRWDKDFLTTRKVIESGTIGKPFYIESRVQGAKGVPGDWRKIKKSGGGMLLDWGVHLIDQIMWMIDSRVTEIYSHIFNITVKEVDDNFKLMLKFENGISAFVEVDTCCFIPLPRWHVTGDGGTMAIYGWHCEGSIERANILHTKLEETIVHTASGPTKTMAPRPPESVETLPLPDIKTDPKDYYRNFVKTVEGKEELIVKPEESLRVMKVIDATFESAKKGIVVKGKF